METGRLIQIEEIYHAALQIPKTEREPFFEKFCGADEDLRREVESLLAFEESSDHFLDRPPESLAAEMFVEQEKQSNLTGKEIGHYKIKKLLGRGGMGEVYLAEDARLKRRVALKILPPEFAADASRRNRFEQEARAASALNHPNIITIHEFGAENGIHFLATEYIEGETLRERIGGDLSLADALDIAAQAAFALSAAHAAGIVHRDIKPENIMIRADGIVKVLDFGIAKLIAAPLNAEGETLEKISTRTKPGALLGTLAYMSPEQIRGETLDARSDVFSLGVCLYEMLTGENPFQQATTGDIIAAILKENPSPVTQENAAFPAELERILSKTLKKKRDERYQTSRDFLLDLKTLRREIEFSESAERTGSKKSLTTNAEAKIYTTNAESISGGFSISKWLPVLLVAVLAFGGAWWFVAKRGFENEPAQPPSAPKTVEVVNWRSTPGEVYSVGAFSPDGKMVAFSSTKIGAKNIWVKQLSGGEAVQITKDDFVNQNPIWSPDGDEIAFFSQRSGTTGIWRMPSFGGSPIYISAIKDSGAILRRWSKSGAIYYESEGNLFKLDVKTAASTALTDFDQAKTNVSSFSVAPDETQVAYVLFENEKYTVLTMPFGGAASQITSGADEIRNVVWHADGKRVLFSQNTNGTFQIFAADAIGSGNPAQVTVGDKDAFALDASADGGKILYGSSKEESDIWGANVEKGEEFSFASDINSELWAAVAPDGKQVAFQSIKDLSQGDKICCGAILTKRIEPETETFQLVANGFLPSWSPDGNRLAFMRVAGETYNIWTINASGGEEKQLTTDGLPSVEYTILPYNRYQTKSFSWSPDSLKIAFISSRSEFNNIWIVDANTSNIMQLTDNTDSKLSVYCPLWTADGKRVAYSSKTNKYLADGKKFYSASVIDAETKNLKLVAQSETYQRLLGWSRADKELVFASISGKDGKGSPMEVNIVQVNVETGERRQLAKLESAYLYNICLSADKKMLAYVSNRDGKDNIWLMGMATGEATRKITSNNDARLYFSTLAWSPDSRTIYFGKQTRYSLLSMVTNFR
jgi:eukaryotic-like serine/threonine-protein kinase